MNRLIYIKYQLKHPKWTRSLLAVTQDNPEIRDHVSESLIQFECANRVKLYDAILTGPAKELLMLEADKSLLPLLWNPSTCGTGDQQSAGGTSYSY
ncbi:hypothetical protein ACFPYJ_01520 [Paenibacillus solisilvae]|uniref:HEAT repeat domain-containing protein n=1 Tax=Paenibacillus solisilvae TaxID=2486751 RepID=A0ABW0VQQ7_9BACL